MRDYDQELADLQTKVRKVQQAKADFDALTDTQRLGDLLHEQLCHYDHGGACSYYYESWQRPGTARGREIRRAALILKLIGRLAEGEFEGSDIDFGMALVRSLKD